MITDTFYCERKGCFMMIGKKLGEGGNSEVFEWGEKKAIKLAKPNTNIWALKNEFQNNMIVWKLGLPVPQPFEMIEYDQRPGLLLERIDAESMKDRLFNIILEKIDNSNHTLDLIDVRMTARFLSELHQYSSEEIRPQGERLKNAIDGVTHLSQVEKVDVIRCLDKLPKKHKICHGDPNPNNVLVKDDALIVIDWNDTTNGNPETDIAEYILMIKHTILPRETPQIIIDTFDSMRETIIHEFMDEYTLHTGITYDDIEPWLLPIAARKLTADAISEEEKQQLVQEIRKKLKQLQ